MTNATQNPGMPQAHALLIGVGSYTNHPGMNVSVYPRNNQGRLANRVAMGYTPSQFSLTP